MASEIGASLEFSLVNGTTEVIQVSGLSMNQTTPGFVHEQFLATTGGALLPVPVGTLGYCFLKNRGTGTVYVLSTSGATTGASACLVGAGEISLFKLGPTLQTPALIAITTASQVEVFIAAL